MTGSDTGLGLEGVGVNAFEAGSGAWRGFALTAPGGTYALFVPPGTYVIATVGSGPYLDELFDDLPCEPYCNVTLGTPVVLGAASDTAGIDFALRVGGQVSGTIRDASGAGVPDISVTAVDEFGVYVGGATSNAAGEYTLQALRTGSYRLRTSNSAGYRDSLYRDRPCWPSCDISTGDLVAVTEGETTAGIDFTLEEGGVITGTVKDAETSQGIAGVMVTAAQPGGPGAVVTTDGDGRYRIRGLTTGIFNVYTSNPLGYLDELYDDLPCEPWCQPGPGTPVAVVDGVVTDHIDFALTRGGDITGTVVDEGTTQPLAGVSVRLFDAAGAWLTSTSTDASGAYRLGGLVSGTYFVSTDTWQDYLDEVYDNRVCEPSCDVTAGDAITVVTGEVRSGIDFALERSGRISGRVTDAETGAALPNVELTVFSSLGSTVGYGWSDASGNYAVGGLPTGSYRVRTRNSSGYLDELYENLPCVQWCDPVAGTPVAVVAGTTTTVDFGLRSGGRIEGWITDANTGSPLADVYVQALPGGPYTGYAVTDASGHYVIGGLADGTYYVFTNNSLGYRNEIYDDIPCTQCWSNATSGTPIPVVVGTSARADFALVRGARITGRVTDLNTGLPLPFSWVGVYDEFNNYVSGASTDASGHYTIPGLESGSYFVVTNTSFNYLDEVYPGVLCEPWCDLTIGTPVPATLGQITADIDFALQVALAIRGIVTDASTGTPLSAVTIEVFGPTGTYSGWTDASGAYLVAGLLPGRYYARTQNQAGYLDELYDGFPCEPSCTPQTGTPLDGVAAMTLYANFALPPGGTISGRITDADSAAPLPNVQVLVFDSGGNQVSYGWSDASGHYAAGGLLTGSYRVRTRNSVGYIDELHDNITCGEWCDLGPGTPVAVVASTTTTVDFGLRLGGTIEGRVTDATTFSNLQYVGVEVFRADGQQVRLAWSDASGHYVVNGLPAATYYARTTNFSGYRDELYDDLPCEPVCDPMAGTPLLVTEGVTTTVDFALLRAGQVSGRVTDAMTGSPLAGVYVQVFGGPGLPGAGYAMTDASGYYVVGGLPDGTYYAFTANGLGYRNEIYDDIPCGSSCYENVSSGSPIPVVVGTIATADFALTAGARISGRVFDQNTALPLSGVWVSVFDGLNNYISGASVDASGNYTVLGLDSGTYYVVTGNSFGYLDEVYADVLCEPWCNVTIGTPVMAVLGQITANIDFALQVGLAIRGVVTDASTVTPLGGVTVEVFGPAGSYSAPTDASGAYLVSGLLPGRYYARTQNAAGYLDELYDGFLCEPTCTPQAGTPLDGAAAMTLFANFALERGGTVTGRVTEASTGAALANVQVNIVDTTGYWLNYGWTDASGYYAVQGLPSGTYRARTLNSLGYMDELYDDRPCVGPCDVVPGDPVAVLAGGITSRIDFALARGGEISGRVTDSFGTAIPSAWVRAHRASDNVAFAALTDAAGSYRITGLLPGDYFVVTQNATGFRDELYDDLPCPGSTCDVTVGERVLVAADTQTTGIDFALARLGRISGRVTDQSSLLGLPDVMVAIYSQAGWQVSTGWTDASGHYEAGGLEAGAYFARTYNGAGYVDQRYDGDDCLNCNVTQGTPIGVLDDQTTTADFALRVGGIISGTVRDASTLSPVWPMRVELYDSIGNGLTQAAVSQIGTYQFTGIPSGTYHVVAAGTMYGYANELYDDKPCTPSCYPSDGDAVAVTEGVAVSGIDFLLDRLGAMAGHVREDGSGLPVYPAVVKVVDGAGTVVGTTWTAADGAWFVSSLPAGTYYAFTETFGNAYRDELYDGLPCEPTCTPTGGTPILVQPGETTSDIDFSLGPATATCAADDSAVVSVKRGGFRYNYALGVFVQQLIVTNASAAPVVGPVSIVLDGLSPNATLVGASGLTSCTSPGGSPYVDMDVGADGVLGPGEAATTVLQFSNPSRASIGYSTRVLTGPNQR